MRRAIDFTEMSAVSGKGMQPEMGIKLSQLLFFSAQNTAERAA
jgi:hypothetical protein